MPVFPSEGRAVCSTKLTLGQCSSWMSTAMVAAAWGTPAARGRGRGRGSGDQADHLGAVQLLDEHRHGGRSLGHTRSPGEGLGLQCSGFRAHVGGVRGGTTGQGRCQCVGRPTEGWVQLGPGRGRTTNESICPQQIFCSAPPCPPSAQHCPTCVQRGPHRRRRRPELLRLGDRHSDHTLVQPGRRHAGQVLHVGAGADREQALAVEDGGDLQGWAWEALRREAGGGRPVNKLWL